MVRSVLPRVLKGTLTLNMRIKARSVLESAVKLKVTV